MDAGTQTDPDEDVEWNLILKMLDNIRAWNPEAYWDIIVETLFKHFSREIRDKRLKEPDFFNLNRLEVKFRDQQQCARWSKSRSDAGMRVGRI